MLDQLTQATFARLMGKRFRLHFADGKNVELELIEANLLPAHPGRLEKNLRREPFSLLFRGPSTLMLPQRIHVLEEETLGRVEIFLVPIGPDEVGQCYEAVFN